MLNQVQHRLIAVRPRDIERALISAIVASELRQSPFDHIYMERIFERGTYQSLIASLPDRRFFHELGHSDAMRADGTSTRLRNYLYPELLWRLPAETRRIWLPVAKALCSSRLQDAFKTKFRSALEERFQKPVARIGLYPIPILLRDQPGYRIGVHSDALSKAITVQFYLPADDSQRHLGTIFHEGKSEANAQRETRMPFLPGSGYAFPVSETKSWHSAAPTQPSDGERVSMMVTYYVADDATSWAKYRWRRSKLIFGIHPSG